MKNTALSIVTEMSEKNIIRFKIPYMEFLKGKGINWMWRRSLC